MPINPAEIPAKETFETKNTSPEVLGELGNTSETIVSTSELESSEIRKEPGSAHQEECSVHAHKEQNGFLVNGVDQKPSLSEFSKTSDLESRDLGSETLGLDSNKNGEQVKFCGTEIQNLNDDIQRQDVHEVSSVGPDVKATNNGSTHHTEEGLTQSERRWSFSLTFSYQSVSAITPKSYQITAARIVSCGFDNQLYFFNNHCNKIRNQTFQDSLHSLW